MRARVLWSHCGSENKHNTHTTCAQQDTQQNADRTCKACSSNSEYTRARYVVTTGGMYKYNDYYYHYDDDVLLMVNCMIASQQ